MTENGWEEVAEEKTMLDSISIKRTETTESQGEPKPLRMKLTHEDCCQITDASKCKRAKHSRVDDEVKRGNGRERREQIIENYNKTSLSFRMRLRKNFNLTQCAGTAERYTLRRLWADKHGHIKRKCRSRQI